MSSAMEAQPKVTLAPLITTVSIQLPGTRVRNSVVCQLRRNLMPIYEMKIEAYTAFLD